MSYPSLLWLYSIIRPTRTLAGGTINKEYIQEIYHYNHKSRKWEPCGSHVAYYISLSMFGSSCAVLQSVDMIVAGTKDVIESKRVWLALKNVFVISQRPSESQSNLFKPTYYLSD